MGFSAGKSKAKARAKATAVASPPAAPYVPTDQERAICNKVRRARQEAPPVARMKVTTGAHQRSITVDHPDPVIGGTILINALGAQNAEIADTILTQVAKTFDISGKDDALASRIVSGAALMVQGIAPRDTTEAMLAAQMVAVHHAMMDAAGRLARVEILDQFEAFSTLLNKLGRTFACQVEALKKYRSTGEQSIRVQHVTVNDGGQAIVGNVGAAGGGVSTKNMDHPYGLNTSEAGQDASGAAMLRQIEALGGPMQGAGAQGVDGVPVSRGSGRSA